MSPTPKPLSHFADLASGGTPSKKNAKFWGGGIPWLTPKDMSTFDGTTADSVHDCAIGNGTKLATAESLFIAVRGMSLHNEIRIVRPRMAMAFNQDIKAIVPKPGTDSTFLYYALSYKVPQLLEWVHAAGHGTGVLSTDLLNSTPIPEFDFEDQVSIGSRLLAFDDKIELNRRMNETLEAMAQAIFRDWFVDFGPTRRKMEGATDPVAILGGLIPVPEKAAPLAAHFPATLGDDGLPESWSQKPLDEIAEQVKASVKPQDAPHELFEHFSIPAFDSGKSPAMDLGETIKSNKTLIPEEAVLLSKLNPEIQRVWLPRKGDEHRQICSTEFLAFTPREPYGRAYLYSLFSERGFRDLLAGMVTGTSKSHQRVAPKALATRLVTVPDEGPVREFEVIAASLLDRVLHNQAENNILAETRDILLPKLMSGEIRLREAEAVA